MKEISWKSFEYWLIDGTKRPRIKHKDNQQNCVECGVSKGSYHNLPCTKEPGVCKKHKYIMDCDCNIFSGEAV